MKSSWRTENAFTHTTSGTGPPEVMWGSEITHLPTKAITIAWDTLVVFVCDRFGRIRTYRAWLDQTLGANDIPALLNVLARRLLEVLPKSFPDFDYAQLTAAAERPTGDAYNGHLTCLEGGPPYTRNSIGNHNR